MDHWAPQQFRFWSWVKSKILILQLTWVGLGRMTQMLPLFCVGTDRSYSPHNCFTIASYDDVISETTAFFSMCNFFLYQPQQSIYIYMKTIENQKSTLFKISLLPRSHFCSVFTTYIWLCMSCFGLLGGEQDSGDWGLQPWNHLCFSSLSQFTYSKDDQNLVCHFWSWASSQLITCFASQRCLKKFFLFHCIIDALIKLFKI